MLKQRTIKEQVRTTGVGVHSGTKVELTLRPAPPDTGIVFSRVDLQPPVVFPVSPLAIGDTRMATVMIRDGHLADEDVITHDAAAFVPRIRNGFVLLQAGMGLGLARGVAALMREDRISSRSASAFFRASEAKPSVTVMRPASLALPVDCRGA